MPPDEERCAYPGCPEPRKDEDADLCKRYHAGRRRAPGATVTDAGLLDNDGLVDWLAVAITVRGERRVRLTWVERDIAIAMLLGMGATPEQVADRTGYTFSESASAIDAARSRKYRRLLDLGTEHYREAEQRAA